MNFPFREDPNTATILCKHIASGEQPILYVSHDEDDGMWQFLCNEDHTIEDLMLVTLKQAYELDPSIGEINDLPLRKRGLEGKSANAVENLKLRMNRWVIVENDSEKDEKE